MAQLSENPPRLIRLKELQKIVPLSRVEIRRRELAGNFPERVRLGPKSSAWNLGEVLDYVAKLPRGVRHGPKSGDEKDHTPRAA